MVLKKKKKNQKNRPKVELVTDFIKWNIDAICILKDYCNYKTKN